MNLGTRVVNGKIMRRGYTTGSCAAAAAKAAALMLFMDKMPESVEIEVAEGTVLRLAVLDRQVSGEGVSCAVKKDAGDDPDVTDGLCVRVEAFETAGGISIEGGSGVGIVTKPGLAVEVGQAAINPGPRELIKREVEKVLPCGKGIRLVVSIPGGERVALRTFNPRLGIVGGLSILGTTGIVEPMSAEAWQESVRLEMKVLAAEGKKNIILVFGNYGENFVQSELGLKKNVIKMSNFVGFALWEAAGIGFEKALLVGELGKLVKVAAGLFNTHSKVADARMETMAAYAGAFGANQETIRTILKMNTTGGALEYLEEKGITGLPEEIVKQAGERARCHVGDRMQVGTVLFSNTRGLLAVDEWGSRIIKELGDESK